jgi:hypothetical protein
MFRYLRLLRRDLKDAYKFYRYRRFFKPYMPMLVMVELKRFDKPEMYISPDMTVRLIKKYKLDPLTLDNTSLDGRGTACLGFSPKTQKWYGWSHRAIYGFTIGDVVSEGDLTTTSGYTEEFEQLNPTEAFRLTLPVGFEAKTLEDAKRMAAAFAASVS